jgi:hypothetical protein
MAIVGQFAWASRLTPGVPLGARLGARGFALSPKPPRGRWTALLGMSGGKVAPSNLYRRLIIHVRNHTRDLLERYRQTSPLQGVKIGRRGCADFSSDSSEAFVYTGLIYLPVN